MPPNAPTLKMPLHRLSQFRATTPNIEAIAKSIQQRRCNVVMPHRSLSIRPSVDIERRMVRKERRKIAIAILVLLLLLKKLSGGIPISLHHRPSVLALLNSSDRWIRQICRMRRSTFYALVSWIRHHTDLTDSCRMDLEGKVLIFLILLS